MLTKETRSVMSAPGSPGHPAVPASTFQLFAPPPAQGYQYNAPVPSSLPAFRQWKQLVAAIIPDEPNYLSVTAFRQRYGGNSSIPGWLPDVGPPYDRDGRPTLYGFYRSPPLPPPNTWFTAPAGMTYMYTKGQVAIAPNGYPVDVVEADFYFRVGGVECGARYQRSDVNGGNFYFRRWLSEPTTTHEMRGWTGIVAVPGDPGSPAVPAVPPTYVLDYLDGWNAGANSETRLDGDVETVFRVNIKAAGAVGFARAGTVVDGRYEKLSHAFFFTGGSCQPMESGRLVGATVPAPSDTTFTLRREAGVVRFYAAGVLVHESMVPSGGPLQVTAALYRGKDQVI